MLGRKYLGPDVSLQVATGAGPRRVPTWVSLVLQALCNITCGALHGLSFFVFRTKKVITIAARTANPNQPR